MSHYHCYHRYCFRASSRISRSKSTDVEQYSEEQGLEEVKRRLREGQLLMKTIPDTIKEEPEEKSEPTYVDSVGTLIVRKKVRVVCQVDPLCRIRDQRAGAGARDGAGGKDGTGDGATVPRSCSLFPENLDLLDGLRVLTRIGAHFYPGRARAVEPPFIFAVRLVD